MVVDILLLVSCFFAVVGKGLVVECHVLSRAQILGELLGNMETRVGVDVNLQAVHLAALGGNHDSAFGTFGTIEHDSLGTLEEGDLLDFRRQHVVGRTLHTVDDDEREVVVVVIIQTVIVHTPQVVAIPTTDQGIHIFQTTHRVILLRQFLHVDIRDTSEKMVCLDVAESNMDYLFSHGSIGLLSCLGIDRHRRSYNHSQKEYICFNIFHILLSIINYRLSIDYHPGFCGKPS